MIIHDNLSDDAMLTYRHECSPEKIGWVIFKTDLTFCIVHRIYLHPEDGPVVMIFDTVWEIDPDQYEIYVDEDAAKDAYYKTSPG